MRKTELPLLAAIAVSFAASCSQQPEMDGADAPADPTESLAEPDAADPLLEGTSASGARKANGGNNGDGDYCNGALQCVAGEGDCDSNAECTGAGVVCLTDNGGRYGFNSTLDFCAPSTCNNRVLDPGETLVDCGGACGSCNPTCSGNNGDGSFCTYHCQCDTGEGDCDSNADCSPGHICAADIGPKYGMPLGHDVCVPASCTNGLEDPGEEGVDCGGTCGNACPAYVFSFPLLPQLEVPPTASLRSGKCTVSVSPNLTQAFVQCTHNVAATAAHIHRAPFGTNGPIVFPLAGFNTVITLSPTDLADLRAGNLYVNFHSATFPGGEIRGQIAQATTINLAGSQEVPPVATGATGRCYLFLPADGDKLGVSCTHNVVNPTAAHIHSAAAGVNGPIVFPFPSPTSPMSGLWDPITPAEVPNLLAGNLYVNVHSAAFPGGQIRGQIAAYCAPGVCSLSCPCNAGQPLDCDADRECAAGSVCGGNNGFLHGASSTTDVCVPAQCDNNVQDGGETGVDCGGPCPATCPAADLAFPLSGRLEVPPNASVATGNCRALLNAAQTQLHVRCTHSVLNSISSPTAAHIHNAPFGVNGGIVFNLGSPASPIDATWNLSPLDVSNLMSGNLYVNVHSTTFPGGEVRGQIGDGVIFPLSGSQEVPANASPATGACIGILSGDQLTAMLNCAHNVVGPTAAHVHNAPFQANGGIIEPFPSPVSPMNLVFAPSAPELAELMAGRLYVNVHSGAFPGGEIRGQVAIPFAFGLSGSQEVPANGSTATGQCLAFLAPSFAEIALGCVHNAVNTTAAHIHQAPRGTNGAVQHALGGGASPIVSFWNAGSPNPLTTNHLLALFAGNLYVNVHTAVFPGGEIRGQIRRW